MLEEQIGKGVKIWLDALGGGEQMFRAVRSRLFQGAPTCGLVMRSGPQRIASGGPLGRAPLTRRSPCARTREIVSLRVLASAALTGL